MELSDYLRVIRAHWVAIIVCTLVGGAVALAWAALQVPRYSANASGFVTAGSSENPALASASDSLAKSRAKSYVDLAESRATAQRVIDQLGLDATPSELITHIAVVQPLDTVLIEVTAEASDADRATALADAWITALAAEVSEVEGGDQGLRVVPVEAAAVPTSPSYPNWALSIGLGLLVGLAVGVGYAVIRNQLDRRIRSAQDLERQFAFPVLATIPIDARAAGARPDPTAIEPTDVRASAYGEAFRKLRTNLQFMNVDDPPRVIVVTSPNQGDGKSTVAARLAITLAAAGESVVLVDADLRRPNVAQRFGLEGAAGLTDVLVGRAEIIDVAVAWGQGIELYLLPAGAVPPNPSELLGSKAMQAVLAALSARALVIIDAAPLLPVTDAAVLTARADGAIIVVAAGKTADRELEASAAHLDAVNGRTLGVVLNRVRKADGGGYERYYAEESGGRRATGR
ncbi:polysaccharide biosynthesis tyrosine autokinase [Agromyces sp. MMS24-JH15]|uniref:polysaccharide biosynthesis tyrosine autokinase n=1 Tax=Agromyces sp. MMS24-JH15 TaxID=3243765 RepID=UPI003747CF5D